MVHDGAPHRVFRISELTRLIAGQLIPTSRTNVVDLACVCRYLEEPVLSTLWETQSSLHVLLRVLPEETWYCGRPTLNMKRVFRITRDPSPEAWKRVQRYASWMHRVHVGEWFVLGEDAFRKLRLNSPASGWFPALQELYWCIAEHNLPYVDLSFSPHLTGISILVSRSWRNSHVPHSLLPVIASIISAFPGSALQSLCVDVGHCMVPWQYFQDSLSSVILRCGPPLVEFVSPIPLSEAAVDHLIQLPRLHTWRIEGPPPNYSASSFPPVFPPLTELTLEEDIARGWLSLFKRLEDNASTTMGVTPLSNVKESLKVLNIGSLPNPIIIDISFTSIRLFQNLVHLNVETDCHDDDEGQCTFKLNDGNVTELATALPRLESLLLGHACFANSCATTVACLLPISVHCVELQKLEVHFNTTNIVDNLKDVSEDTRFQELRSLPRCSLLRLDVYRMPLTLDDPGFETVASGMIIIFPSLWACDGLDDAWGELSERIAKIQEM